ncbi:LuxE/PaaK family acyltransferase [Mucilaginibacter ginsenosidivorax]|uniref:Acyl transferase n=1 Tax=Mucilaginibacter ginsenosidivorax TaxID=862126 RepID=A0A5B8VWF7_9SPHI|nr:acyl transferase [Mucilaginibacter ginsenosidivorax]QEC75521.1 acyl transferase [Mucilaginibacter ginsenosidivorax]
MTIPGKQQVFSINNKEQFEQTALEVFKYQAQNCVIYRQFIEGLKIDLTKVTTVEKIPFLPIEFFKSHAVVSSNDLIEVTFTSSGTTGMITSSHHVTDKTWYEDSFRNAFGLFYGDIKAYTVLALLPSYLEREGSSLIYMVDDLIKQSDNPDSGFFLYNHYELYQQLIKQQEAQKPTLLIGVTFGLLDFIEQYSINFPGLIVMETGGMKGRRKEMIREELHQALCKGFGVSAIHSEYGMTELLSQAYSKGEGIFDCPPWMQIIIRDTNDPITTLSNGKTGGINVVDLANINSCSFIATQDLGKTYTDGSFEVLGRFDQSDIRGCNLLIA